MTNDEFLMKTRSIIGGGELYKSEVSEAISATAKAIGAKEVSSNGSEYMVVDAEQFLNVFALKLKGQY